jgi:hypothetical protein
MQREFVDAFAEFTSANILGVNVYSTGYRGGDSGHGGKTEITLTNVASTDMQVEITDESGKKISVEYLESVKLVFSGDTELDTLVASLKFVLSTLEP